MGGHPLEKFRCLRCVHCCFFRVVEEAPVVFPWEKRLLEELAEREGVELSFDPLEVYADSSARCAVALYRWVIRGFCPFYRIAGSRCTIHELKPLACRMYPLVVNVETGEIAVSTKCDWIERRLTGLKAVDGRVETVLKLFPEEGRAAVEAFILYRELVRALHELGLKRVEGRAACKELLDADDYVARYA